MCYDHEKRIMITLVFLITLPTLCFAANISLNPSLFNYAFARTMSENYVLDLKELYAEDQNLLPLTVFWQLGTNIKKKRSEINKIKYMVYEVLRMARLECN